MMKSSREKLSFGTYAIAKMCHVTPPTVGRWIEDGKLPSFSTGGGHRRVWIDDLIAFLKEHNIPLPPPLASRDNPRILIVDDDASVRRLVSCVASKTYPGAELHEAGDGFEAGHKIATLRPSLIILDIQLPGVDGVKVCLTARADPSLSGVRILAISGVAPDDARRRILEAGANDFLAKPFTPEELGRRMAALYSVPSQTASPRPKRKIA